MQGALPRDAAPQSRERRRTLKSSKCIDHCRATLSTESEASASFEIVEMQQAPPRDAAATEPRASASVEVVEVQ